MDASVQRALTDKLYEKRKVGALELEKLVREASAAKDHEKVKKIIHQLCHDFAYAVHQPYARNGGLIGLAAAGIALGSEVAQHLEEIVPPVLACFTDQDARVRYYACESMYNIAKVAKGEILPYFNDVFDALCKLAADSELSVKNGAELLDRLIKDIVAESAATYVSILQQDYEKAIVESDDEESEDSDDLPTAFSLARFIPLLKERIHVINPFTRTFLVSWITLLDSIPDLELVAYLPAFLGGLFRFLNDPNRDVRVTTQGALDKFLSEIRRIAHIKRGLDDNRKGRSDEKSQQPPTPEQGNPHHGSNEDGTPREDEQIGSGDEDSAIADEALESGSDGDWIPGQDVQVDHPRILEILLSFLDSSTSEEEIQLTSLRWIDGFFDIAPEDILAFVPRLLSQVLPAMASDVEQVRQAANRVNTSLMQYIVSLSEEAKENAPPLPAVRDAAGDRRESAPTSRSPQPAVKEKDKAREEGVQTPPPPPYEASLPHQSMADLDYAAAVNALTLQFQNEHEVTRVAALTWLIMLHRKAPRKVLAVNDETFPDLLKTLSDPAEAVVTRDLQLLSQISKNSEDNYFSSFMVKLLQLFCTDRRLLETRGNLIIRQLCASLSTERIYRTLADCLEQDEDVEFASIMVQNLNNNLITAPELSELRKRLRNLETRDGQTFFVALFRSWCHNAVATFSLCLLAQAYEQAYNLLQIFAELEMTINMLIQIDKLVQLLESPVFTYLRLQLLEPEKYPHLYKCLYGLLMLLPQSSAFAALKNRLNSVSAIGYLHVAPRPTPTTSNSGYERPTRLKGREGTDLSSGSGIKWNDLLEKFRHTQEKARRQQLQRQQSQLRGDAVPGDDDFGPNGALTTVNRNFGGLMIDGRLANAAATNLGHDPRGGGAVGGGGSSSSGVPASAGLTPQTAGRHAGSSGMLRPPSRGDVMGQTSAPASPGVMNSPSGGMGTPGGPPSGPGPQAPSHVRQKSSLKDGFGRLSGAVGVGGKRTTKR
ncbi:MAG: hypothetical protein M1817_006778 [Caeruleum heppii]|nr:MAG: hypothetical protein M1817_006778 [Caeruleum heppii]